jgi:hypothetical protein
MDAQTIDPSWEQIEARRERRAAAAELLAKSLGEQPLRGMIELMPPLATTVQDNPLTPSGVLEPRVWQAVTPPLYEVLQGRAQSEQLSPTLDVRQLHSVPPPFGVQPPITAHGGHEPARQVVNTDPRGQMSIVTAAGSESTQTTTVTGLRVPITPLFAGGTLSFRPRVEYWDQHYLEAAGSAESHSDGFIHAAVFSSFSDGTDMRPEAAAPGSRIWNVRASATFGTSMGQPLDSRVPDDTGTLSGWQLQVDVGDIDTERMYLGQVRIETHSDADGDHLLYASHATVAFFAWLRVAVVEQNA